MPSRRAFGCALGGAAFLGLTRLAFGQVPLPGNPARDFVSPGYRPGADTDEQGLWAIMDRAESELKNSRFVIRDPGVNAYLREIVCRLAKDHCTDVRIYLVRTPVFNASMAPNGMLQVFSGLLLRCSDEAQLATILGHELGHYLRRHTLQGWRDARGKADFGAFLGLGLALAGAGVGGLLAQAALVASAFAYNRDQEREADEIGLAIMADAGYAPAATAEVWDQLLAEFKGATAERDKSVFFASHPKPEERLETLRRAAQAKGGEKGDRGEDRYRENLKPIRAKLIGDELSLRQPGRSEILFDRLLGREPEDGGLWFAKGEVYRLRGEGDDPSRALAAYQRALAAKGAPAETHRSMMLVQLKMGALREAHAAFDAYLKASPGASDADALRMLLSQ